LQDGIIDMNGVRTKIDDKDSILAAKEGGPILDSLRDVIISNQRNRIDMNEIRKAVQEGIIAGMKVIGAGSDQQQPVIISMNGEKVGEALLKSGFTKMMTNPNKTNQYPTLNANSLQYPSGEEIRSRFDNT